MIDYAFKFVDEASAKTALTGYWLPVDGDWVWDTARVMATTRCGSTLPFYLYYGTDQIPGYYVSVSVPAIDGSLWSIAQCIVEGDRVSATIVRTRLDAEEQLAANFNPVMAGTNYVFAGQGKNFPLDNTNHPIGDSFGADVEGN